MGDGLPSERWAAGVGRVAGVDWMGESAVARAGDELAHGGGEDGLGGQEEEESTGGGGGVKHK